MRTRPVGSECADEAHPISDRLVCASHESERSADAGAEKPATTYLDVAIRGNEKIELLFNTELVNIEGATKIEKVTLKNTRDGESRSLPAAAVFVFTGQKPQSDDFLDDLTLRIEDGHILTRLDLVRDGRRPAGWPPDRDPLLLETSAPGVFAAGDVRNGTKHGVAAATGDGNAAVSMFWQYLATVRSSGRRSGRAFHIHDAFSGGAAPSCAAISSMTISVARKFLPAHPDAGLTLIPASGRRERGKQRNGRLPRLPIRRCVGWLRREPTRRWSSPPASP